MRIVFIGSVKFSESALGKLIGLGAEVVGVVTKRTAPSNSDFCDLEPLAQKNKIPVFHTKDINSEDSEAWIKKHSPELIICLGWSNILKSNILDIPPMGVLGFHPSLLPYNRGRHPLIWALALGLSETGSTFFFMDEGVDTGDIVSQERVEILNEDDAGTLYSKITDTALAQIENFYPQITNREFKRIPQLKNVGNVWRKRGQRDGEIDFRMSPEAICGLVRALTKPYVGAHLRFQGHEIKIWKAKALPIKGSCNLEPGLVLDVSNAGVIAVKTGGGVVELLEHEFKNLPKKGDYL